MARRKRVLDDGDDSDSMDDSDQPDLDFDNDPDAREERALFENPYAHKRRKKNGKEDALYGIFAENSDEDEVRNRGPSKRRDWMKAPAFVTSDKPATLDDSFPMSVDADGVIDNTSDEGSVQDERAGEDNELEGEDQPQEDAEYSDESESFRAPSPRVRIEEEEEEEEEEPLPKPRIGGLGFKSSGSSNALLFSQSATGSSLAEPTPSLPRGGIGSKTDNTSSTQLDDTVTTTPSLGSSELAKEIPFAFGKQAQSFNRTTSNSPKPVALPMAEMAHFSKIQGSFGARMLAKMGWQAGTGLGAAGEGIVIPIESKLRPQKMGIAFKGFREKTEQSKLEAKRRGEVVSGDEDEKTKKFKKRAREQQEKRADAWKRPKKVKTKVEHKTYEQILAEAGEEAPLPNIGQIIDATGAVPREVSSLADISLNTWSPSNDPTRIPEMRHNVRLIADACKTDLDGLAREAKALQERKKFVITEDVRLRKRVEDEAEMIARLQRIQLVANDINEKTKEMSSLYEASLEPFSPLVTTLIHDYSSEYEKYGLDEIVVGAIAPVMRRMVANWNPLEEPTFFLPMLRSWRRALKFNDEEAKPETSVDVYGSTITVTQPVNLERPMTPFESLLWNVWLPKVRTSINDDWLADEPQAAVKLYEVWSTFLPSFIRDNLLDQLILPKVQKAVASWTARQSKVSLQAIVFPWLPYVGLRLEDVIGDARRKIKNLLRNWVVEEPAPADLLAWKDVFNVADWDAMLLKYVVPKLGATLRNDFQINPRDQRMEPLQRVFAWSQLIRASVFSQILETEFFPKWLDILHIWLIQPRVSFEEVAQWYSFWKETFPEEVRTLPRINRGFTRGLQLMNKAIELGPDAATKLAKPDFLGELSAPSSPRPGKDAEKVHKPSIRTHEITFRSIVEEFAAAHNLLFIPVGKAHERSRMPLFRVSRTADGRKGLLVYILDDAVWAPKTDGANLEGEEFKAISLEDMVSRATT